MSGFSARNICAARVDSFIRTINAVRRTRARRRLRPPPSVYAPPRSPRRWHRASPGGTLAPDVEQAAIDAQGNPRAVRSGETAGGDRLALVPRVVVRLVHDEGTLHSLLHEILLVDVPPEDGEQAPHFMDGLDNHAPYCVFDPVQRIPFRHGCRFARPARRIVADAILIAPADG